MSLEKFRNFREKGPEVSHVVVLCNPETMASSKDSPDIEVSFQNQERMKKYTLLILLNDHRI